ncbi:MAG: tryptophan--tRNA ligase [Vampirovibrionales bacterium]|nr:tryptophan--tRNA ligase [Vampirovibrionales bacterium]
MTLDSDLKASAPKRVMSGMRPTGRLHLGHYWGVLKNWESLQAQYDCFFMVADWHALTTRYDQTADLRAHTRDMLADWLAAGVDPARATVYVQSSVPEIAELSLILGMLTPLPWVQGDPTLKDMVKMLHEELNYGLLGYPVLQTADILAMRGDLVPVGKDQLAHLEISRDIARRFNHVYQRDYFPEPRPLLTQQPLMMGLDGAKMGKSAGNAILLSDDADETCRKIRTAITDPARQRRQDPGDPEQCQVVFKYYPLFAPPDAVEQTAAECRSAARGCVDCKKLLAEYLNETLRPIRERRRTLADDPGELDRLLRAGGEKARAVASDTLRGVREAVQLPTF